MSAPVIPFPHPMPTSAAGRVLWAKTAMIESARVWAEAIRPRPNASAEDIQAAHDECANILDGFLNCAKRFTDALEGDYDALERYFRDGIGDGLEFGLARWAEDLGGDAEDSNAEHRITKFEALGGR